MYNKGDIVEAICSDWIFDNPMIVVEEDHVCPCGCGYKHVITCMGKSGNIYEDVDCVFDLKDNIK